MISRDKLKNLKTILTNKDIIQRFKLCQLWAVDAFVDSLDVAINHDHIIDLYVQSVNNDNITPENLLTSLNNIRVDIINENEILKRTLKQIETLSRIDQLIDNTEESKTNYGGDINKLNNIIQTNEKRIENLGKINVSQLETSSPRV